MKIILLISARQRSLLETNNLRLTASDAPLVSILVPARNEQHRVLEHCIRSILAQDYGRFEIIAVNDRSTDETRAIFERLAKRILATDADMIFERAALRWSVPLKLKVMR